MGFSYAGTWGVEILIEIDVEKYRLGVKIAGCSLVLGWRDLALRAAVSFGVWSDYVLFY